MNEANFYMQQHATINGREVFLYLITCPIGYIFVVQYEDRYKALETILINASLQKAEKKFEGICTKILKGAL